MPKNPKLGQTQRGLIATLLCLAFVIAIFDSQSSRSPPSYNQSATKAEYRSSPIAAEEPPKITDWLLVLFNGLLFGSTALLWVANNRSAKIAERALTELEAPFLSIKIIDTGITRSYGKTGHDFQIIRFCVVNYGRTPARLIELVDRFALLDINAGLPPEANPQSATRNTMPYGVIAPPSGESQEFTNNVFAAMMNALVNDPLPLQTKALFFYGFVRYSTIFNEVYRLGFCFMFDKFSEKWLLAGGEKHNYCRKESGPTP
jgi:hypothetical protein